MADKRIRVESKVEWVTPELGAAYLRLNTYAHQRPLRGHHVSFLAGVMRRGEFRQASGIDIAQIGEESVLANGQHTLHALGQTQLGQVLTVTYHYLESWADFPALYASFDKHLRRTHADALGAYELVDRLGVGKTYLNAAASALPLLIAGFTQYETQRTAGLVALFRSSTLRARSLEVWGREVRSYYEALSGVKTTYTRRYNMLIRASVMAVGFVTYRFQPEKAEAFWRGAVLDDGLRRGDPRKTLLNFLIEKPAQVYRHGQYSKYVAVAWNAFYSGRKVQSLRVMDPQAPIRLSGTPHGGKRVMVYFRGEGELLTAPIPAER